MKSKTGAKSGLFAVLLLASALFSGSAMANFCWKASYGRGVGTVPIGCEGGGDFQAGLCYAKCPAGLSGVGPVCWAHCPAGWTDHGVGCTKPKPYGNGGGYPWKFGDALNLSGATKRCQAAHAEGCEKHGEIMYPKCKAGFHPVGGNICSPSCPAGFTDTGIACTKPSSPRGVGKPPTQCAPGHQFDVGLCYADCKSDFGGVGPVCWKKCTGSTSVNCGAGCASASDECAHVIMDQVVSVLDVAVNIATTAATAGAGTAVKASAQTAAKTAAKAAAKQAAQKTVVRGASKSAIKGTIKDILKDQGKTMGENAIDQLAAMGAGEDFDPYALDPTGIASVVKAYNKPICK